MKQEFSQRFGSFFIVFLRVAAALLLLASVIALAIRAFLRLEAYRLKTGISWFEAKQVIIRHAIRAYLKNPTY